MSSRIDGLLISRHEKSEPDYELTEPLFILMAQGAKRLYLEEQVIEYHAGECLVVTASLPVSGHFIAASPADPALAIGLRLRASAIAALVPDLPARQQALRAPGRAIGTVLADADLLGAAVRLVCLLDRPSDIAVLAPMIEREILWRLLTGPLGPSVAQIGLADSSLTHIRRAIAWIRENFAEPIAVPELAAMVGMSASTFHRHFRATTGMTPLQFHKHLRLHEARSLLVAHARDVTGVARVVGYESPTQFNREYRRLFGAPPGRDAGVLRTKLASQ
jgi:AraC-like DNA-binding protein